MRSCSSKRPRTGRGRQVADDRRQSPQSETSQTSTSSMVTSRVIQDSRTRNGKTYNTSTFCVQDRVPNNHSRQTTWADIKQQYEEDILRRISRIPLKDVSIPVSRNLKILVSELKIRLAMISDVITETPGPRGQVVMVTSRHSGSRFVPIWSINREQDPELICEVKVGIVPEENCRRRTRSAAHR